MSVAKHPWVIAIAKILFTKHDLDSCFRGNGGISLLQNGEEFLAIAGDDSGHLALTYIDSGIAHRVPEGERRKNQAIGRLKTTKEVCDG